MSPQRLLLCLTLLSATALTAATQNFLLGVDYTASIPTGPILGPANLSASTDSQGNLYVLMNGLTGACQPTPFFCAPIMGSFLVKLAPEGKTVLYQQALSFLAGTMAVDAGGNVYLAGFSFVEKLGADGATVLYQTSIGGSTLDIQAMALDSAGRVYVTGVVNAGGLQTTSGAFQQSALDATGPNGFVVRLNPAGAIDYATYLGADAGSPYGIAVDGSGSAFVMWTTYSAAFPVTAGAYSTSGLSELARLSPDGSALLYSTFIGGPANTGWFLAVDSGGHAAAALDELGYGWGLAVESFNTEGTGITFSQFLPGVSFVGLAVDSSGFIYADDVLLPASANYPVKNSLATCGSGAGTALTVFDGSGNIVQSTYLPVGSTSGGFAVLPDSTVGVFTQPVAGSLTLTHLSQDPQAPTVQLACIGNAASFDSTVISPGEIVSLFGNGLGPATGTAPPGGATLPTRIAGVEVTFNKTPAPLLYVQDGQINAIAPWSLSPRTPVRICVVDNGTPTNCLNAFVELVDPGVFMESPYRALALNEDGSVNSAANPARVRTVATIFATGLGELNPQPADGAIIGLPLPQDDVQPVTMCTFNQSLLCTPEIIRYAGPVQGQVAGLSEIRFTVDADMGGVFATELTVGGWTKSNPFYIYVAPAPPPARNPNPPKRH